MNKDKLILKNFAQQFFNTVNSEDFMILVEKLTIRYIPAKEKFIDFVTDGYIVFNLLSWDSTNGGMKPETTPLEEMNKDKLKIRKSLAYLFLNYLIDNKVDSNIILKYLRNKETNTEGTLKKEILDILKKDKDVFSSYILDLPIVKNTHLIKENLHLLNSNSKILLFNQIVNLERFKHVDMQFDWHGIVLDDVVLKNMYLKYFDKVKNYGVNDIISSVELQDSMKLTYDVTNFYGFNKQRQYSVLELERMLQSQFIDLAENNVFKKAFNIAEVYIKPMGKSNNNMYLTIVGSNLNVSDINKFCDEVIKQTLQLDSKKGFENILEDSNIESIILQNDIDEIKKTRKTMLKPIIK